MTFSPCFCPSQTSFWGCSEARLVSPQGKLERMDRMQFRFLPSLLPASFVYSPCLPLFSQVSHGTLAPGSGWPVARVCWRKQVVLGDCWVCGRQTEPYGSLVPRSAEEQLSPEASFPSVSSAHSGFLTARTEANCQQTEKEWQRLIHSDIHFRHLCFIPTTFASFY